MKWIGVIFISLASQLQARTWLLKLSILICLYNCKQDH